jgi:hypothetical protein
MSKLLMVTRCGNDGTEYIHPDSIESIRPSNPRQHSPDSHSVVRSKSGREIAVVEHYQPLVELWESALARISHERSK